MSETLKQRIQSDMKAAMRAKDRKRLGVIRLITAAIKQVEVDERIEGLDDARVIEVLQKMLKQRRESVKQYVAGAREDLAEIERWEMELIQAYLPQPLGESEIDALVEQVLAETGAASLKDMGRVMALLKQRARGRADMGALGATVRQRLSGRA